MQVLTGEDLVDGEAGGQWHAPKVLMGVTPGMRTWREDADIDSLLCNKRPVQVATGGSMMDGAWGGQSIHHAPIVLGLSHRACASGEIGVWTSDGHCEVWQ